MSDYDFDILEKEYNDLAEEIGIDKELQVSEFVGFSLNIPMNLNNYYKEVSSVIIFTSENCSPCKRLLKILETKDISDVKIEVKDSKYNTELIDKCSVKASPTILFFDKNENIIKKTMGSTLPENMRYVRI